MYSYVRTTPRAPGNTHGNVADCHAFRFCSECVHMPQRRASNRRGMSCLWCCEVCVVQPRVHSQSRLHKVYSYVCNALMADTNTIGTECCVLRMSRAANGCACANGVAQTGAHCPITGASKCHSCNPGFTINAAKTACIRTCNKCDRWNMHSFRTQVAKGKIQRFYRLRL